jgi:preprotein translocase subunit SecF
LPGTLAKGGARMNNNTFTGHTRLFLCISATIIVAALLMSIFGYGMNMGIDFTGGSLLTYDMGGEFQVSVVEDALKAQGLTEWQVVKTGEGDVKTQLQVRLKLLDNSDDVRTGFESTLKETYPDMTFVDIGQVGAVAGKDLINNAIKSLLISFFCLLIYIAIRFDFYSGLAALLALLHDVLIMFSFMVFFRGMFQVNSPFIAALLTIIGYSINNTIVIFDRIRENVKSPVYSQGTRKNIVESSVRSTLTRTVNTSLTTLFTLVALFVLGVSSIREFTFPLIVGMLAGTYSSVMLSGQIWAHWIDNNSFAKVKNLFVKKAKA